MLDFLQIAESVKSLNRDSLIQSGAMEDEDLSRKMTELQNQAVLALHEMEKLMEEFCAKRDSK